MADLRRCLVVASIVTAEGGRMLGPGQLVDLDALVGGGHTLRECVDVAWFASAEPEQDPNRPVSRRRPPMGKGDPVSA